ncbi:SIMPL domain-containing protein [Actibacterium lipolyticum]|uniref:26 kDa periplasmic immunogenic protein n=1 Tax=Actibacterium lipolyticum TaxID=1524263 RepID=A0A238JV46_9RHOB|nr:SIMPL domain-containing protein [Actibacterium lipolyticum]SMX33626.1 26 kDa periplasmic immunogenic protein precursor [Actibacterium lipolyticum]
MRFLSVLFIGLTIASSALAEAPVPTITVVGTGEVAGEPDMATIILGVTNAGKTAAEAMDQTSASTADILEALRNAGIAPRDLQTRDLSLNPNWNNRSSTPGAPTIDGFIASNTVMVRVRDLDSLGGVLDQVLNLGANTFRGLSFGLQDPKPAQDEARRAAVGDAMAKATLYAQAAGLNLGQVISISEAGGNVPMPLMMESARMSADMPVAAGEVSLSSSVTMVFAIAQ